MKSQYQIWRKSLLGSLYRLIHSLFQTKINNLPNNQVLWRAVNKITQLDSDGYLHISFFIDKSGLSANLATFSTLEKTRRGSRKHEPYPEGSGIAEFTIRSVRKISNCACNVEHKPIPNSSDFIKTYGHCVLTSKLTKSNAKKMKDSKVTKLILKPNLDDNFR